MPSSPNQLQPLHNYGKEFVQMQITNEGVGIRNCLLNCRVKLFIMTHARGQGWIKYMALKLVVILSPLKKGE
jgi:hypothetical protein